VLCFLQEDAQELADPVRLARLIKQYSQFIQFPIKLWSAKKEAKQVRQHDGDMCCCTVDYTDQTRHLLEGAAPWTIAG
jgi:heat shock protein beta